MSCGGIVITFSCDGKASTAFSIHQPLCKVHQPLQSGRWMCHSHSLKVGGDVLPGRFFCTPNQRLFQWMLPLYGLQTVCTLTSKLWHQRLSLTHVFPSFETILWKPFRWLCAKNAGRAAAEIFRSARLTPTTVFTMLKKSHFKMNFPRRAVASESFSKSSLPHRLFDWPISQMLWQALFGILKIKKKKEGGAWGNSASSVWVP